MYEMSCEWKLHGQFSFFEINFYDINFLAVTNRSIHRQRQGDET